MLCTIECQQGAGGLVFFHCNQLGRDGLGIAGANLSVLDSF